MINITGSKTAMLIMLSCLALGALRGLTAEEDLTQPMTLLKNSTGADSLIQAVPANPLPDPLRPPREFNSGFHIIVRKGTHQLSLFKDGILQNTWPVGTGKNPADKGKTQDAATPEGYFRLKAIHDATKWLYVPPGGGGQFKNVYGPWFLAVDTGSGSFTGKAWSGIGIHGTNKPESIGHDVSLGCIRMHNEDVTALKAILDSVEDIKQVQVDILP